MDTNPLAIVPLAPAPALQPLPPQHPAVVMDDRARQNRVTGKFRPVPSLAAPEGRSGVTRGVLWGWSRDAKHLLRGPRGASFGVEVLDAPTGRVVGRSFERPERGLGWSADGSRLYIRGYHGLSCHNVLTGAQIGAVVEDENIGLAVAAGAQRALTLGKDRRTLSVYDADLQCLVERAAPFTMWKVDLSANGVWALLAPMTVDEERPLSLMNLATGDTRPLLDGGGFAVAQFAALGAHLMVAHDKVTEIYDCNTATLVRAIPCAERFGFERKRLVMMSPDGRQVATFSGDAYAICDIAAGTEHVLPVTLASSLEDVCFAPDNDILVTRESTRAGHRLTAFSTHTGKPLWSTNLATYAADGPMAWSGDGRYLIVGRMVLDFHQPPKPLRRWANALGRKLVKGEVTSW